MENDSLLESYLNELTTDELYNKYFMVYPKPIFLLDKKRNKWKKINKNLNILSINVDKLNDQKNKKNQDALYTLLTE